MKTAPNPRPRRHCAAILLPATLILVMTSACASAPRAPAADERLSTPPPPPTFLALSDVHYGDSLDGNDWYCSVNSGQCESSNTLLQDALAEASSLIQAHQPGFVIYLGDLPAHNEPQSNRTQEFTKVLGGLNILVANTEVPLLFLPGNNDSVDADYCAFTASNGRTPLDYAPVTDAWPVVNGKDDIIDSNMTLGYYSVHPLGKPTSGPALRVIALNTVIFTKNYRGCLGSITQNQDTKDQMDWLGRQLKDAQNEKVLLAMHVPPGTDGYGGNPMWDTQLAYNGEWVQQAFLKMVGQYSNQIVGVLTSHTHTNGIRRLHDCGGEFIELGISIPGITTDHANNPAMKLFTYSPTNYQLLDNQTFYASPSTHKNWAAGNDFTFRSSYPCTSCSGGETLFERISKIGDTQTIVSDMKDVLLVKSGQTLGGCCYEAALDVTCDLPILPPN